MSSKNSQTESCGSRNYANVAVKEELNKNLFSIPTSIKENGEEVTCEHLDTIVEQSPWIVNGKPLMVQKWNPDVCIKKAEPGKIPIWIKLSNIPLEAWSVKGIIALSSKLGKPLVMDNMTASMCHNGTGRAAYARVMIEIDAKKGYKDSIEIHYKDKHDCLIRTKFVKVEYSWKPASCSTCGVFGHSNSSCQNIRVNIDKQDEKKKYQKKQDDEGFIEVKGRKNVSNGNGAQRMKEQNNKKEYKMVNEKDKGNIQYMYKPKEDAMKNQQKPKKGMQDNNDKFKTPSRVNKDEEEGMERNDGTKDRRIEVDKFISEQRQPTSNETKDWTYDMNEYFKYRWEDIQRKKYMIESESDTDIECEMNEADKNLVANEIDGVDTEVLFN
ncbi:RNA-directed DNA polymerase, eukaryota, reverse transcriptase zinc-binding domain protein [Tanacetum coccineum]